jgi:hypothetical protein
MCAAFFNFRLDDGLLLSNPPKRELARMVSGLQALSRKRHTVFLFKHIHRAPGHVHFTVQMSCPFFSTIDLGRFALTLRVQESGTSFGG